MALMDSFFQLKTYFVIVSFITVFVILNLLGSMRYIYAYKEIMKKIEMPTSSSMYIYLMSNSPIISDKKVMLNYNITSKTAMAVAPTPTPRPNNCTGCFQHNFKYMISNEAVCNVKGNNSVELFGFIFTIHSNSEQRNAIRKTWMSFAGNNTSNVRYLFMLGKSSNDELNKKVAEEATIFNDILMEDFHDSYQNLTYKTMMGFKYVTKFCNHTKYVLKIDDDIWLNMPSLLKLLQKEGNKLTAAVGGACHASAGPIRSKSSKWYASFTSYPSNSYPGFCSGTGYVLSANVAQKVYEVSKNVPFFHLEDVYVALCIKKLNYKLIRFSGFLKGWSKNNLCAMKSDDTRTCHQVPPNILTSAWAAVC
ncbi:beta-1,3-galactosyltransferase 1-like [Patella vulgata]|uniref:beta-1,3-galactosyltransferase 1 n=1 Tax=Patella vulgata TaxID=6465 RepID=UPI0021803B92|nr:beta-1,3-galactosyltransferase 1 [Patella vulgata]XP_050418223.1 beta-1,3-galactosyltransferase 1 [Patella vulgata]XP_050418226.1 beta-1,3-galactosyltransferase 1-like [Patella vulgata]